MLIARQSPTIIHLESRLQSDDRSDKTIEVATTTAGWRSGTGAGAVRGGDGNGDDGLEPPGAAHVSVYARYAHTLDELRLGLRPTVQTEVWVEPSGSGTRWPPVAGRRIEAKRDISILTSGRREAS
ncbi:hypothetical protein VTH06DRAFT_4798 [Thermothelomyces fergusii]